MGTGGSLRLTFTFVRACVRAFGARGQAGSSGCHGNGLAVVDGRAATDSLAAADVCTDGLWYKIQPGRAAGRVRLGEPGCRIPCYQVAFMSVATVLQGNTSITACDEAFAGIRADARGCPNHIGVIACQCLCGEIAEQEWQMMLEANRCAASGMV